jgi:hypothetical protein
MYAYDAVYMFAETIDRMLERGEDVNSGKELVNGLKASDFVGASGSVKITQGTNDRNAIGYAIVNMQDEEPTVVARYDPNDPNLFSYLETVSIIYGDGENSAPEDEWDEEYDCPFAFHMEKLSIPGLIVVVSIGTFLTAITVILSVFSYRKWMHVKIHLIMEPVVRSWRDSVVQATILIEFFQFVAIAPELQSLKIVIRILSNLFLLDVVKMAAADKSGYWTLLIVICCIVFAWFLMVAAIMLNVDRLLSRFPFIQRSF